MIFKNSNKEGYLFKIKLFLNNVDSIKTLYKKTTSKKSKIKIFSFHEKRFQETIDFDHLSKLTQALEIKFIVIILLSFIIEEFNQLPITFHKSICSTDAR